MPAKEVTIGGVSLTALLRTLAASSLGDLLTLTNDGAVRIWAGRELAGLSD